MAESNEAEKIKKENEEQEISVYETVTEPENGDISEEIPAEEENPDEKTDTPGKPKKEFPFKNLSLKSFYIIAGAMVFLIIALIAFAIILTNVRTGIPKGVVVLTLPDLNNTNNSNYIFIKDEMVINKTEVKLMGILADSQASVFYFNQMFPVGCMDIFLRDSDGNAYYLDLSHHTENGWSDRLFFEPFNEGITYFEMVLTNGGAEETVYRLYYFDRELELPPVTYVENQSIEMEVEGCHALFKIDEAVFSPAGSYIDYSFSWEDNRFRISPDSGNSRFIRVSNNGLAIPVIKGYALQNEANEKLIMGREGFRPLKTSGGSVKITISNLLSRINVNKTVDVEPLFQDEPGYEYILRLGDYKLVLERMGKGKSIYMLVLHMEDLRLPVPSSDNVYSNRVYASYDIELIGKDENGRRVALKPEQHLSKNGADLVFRDTDGEIVYISPSDVQLRLNSVDIEMDDVDFELNLSSLPGERSERIQSALESIINLYKYENRDLNMYTAQIISHTVSGNEITALACESGVSGGEVFYRKHAVTAVLQNGGASILSDVEI